MHANDISWLSLALGSLVMIIPIIVLWYYRTGLLKDLFISTARMSIQLMLAGFYLKYIFALDNLYINIGWVVLMIIAASSTIVKRADLQIKDFYLPVLFGVLINVIINGAIFALAVMSGQEFFSARYLIPIMGMVIGNTLTATIVGIKSFFQSIQKDEDHYKYMLMCGASKSESLFDYISAALKMAFSPTIAQNATIGLIWLPGMMTGQILGGSDPLTAIKYQILIIVAIFAGGVLSVMTTLSLTKNFAFDDLDMLKKVFKQHK